MVILTFSHCSMPHNVISVCAGSISLAISYPRIVTLLPLVYRVAEEFLSPPYPRLSNPSTPSPSGLTPEVSSPQGNSSTPGVSVPFGESTPPPTPWQSPRDFLPLRRPWAPLPESHSRGFPGQVFRPADNPLPFPFSRPMAASRSRCVRIFKGGFQGGAPVGRCAPRSVFHAISLQFPFRCRQH